MSNEPKSDSSGLERLFEAFLWKGRIVILLAVGGLLVGALIVFLVGVLETVSLAVHAAQSVSTYGFDQDPKFYNEVLVNVITLVDILLVGIALLIFGLGTYDLFISRLEPAQKQRDIRHDWFVFDSLDALKDKLGKVVIVILIITFLKSVVNIEFREPIDLVWLGAGICLVALSLRFHTEKKGLADKGPGHGNTLDDV
ncbi:MAG: YqhA family protein [Candidatus Hydrogenedentes bacterium]|nr:YqhA family protein [Candidatus Hydrogenedentota bacterium]